MNLPNKQTASGSVVTLADELKRIMTSTVTPEEFKRQKAELKSAEERNRIISRERHMAHLKEGARRTLRGDIDDE